MTAAPGGIAQARGIPALTQIAQASTVDLGKSGVLHVYTARLPSGALADRDAVVSALIAIHGHPRDANRTLGAGALAARRAGRASDTIAVAPLFQVSAAGRCEFPGNPAAQPGDALWTCESWLDGGTAEGGGPTSFRAMDMVVVDLVRHWPRLRTVTVAGFSAGAQFVQRYIGFARPAGGRAPALCRFRSGDVALFRSAASAADGRWLRLEALPRLCLRLHMADDGDGLRAGEPMEIRNRRGSGDSWVDRRRSACALRRGGPRLSGRRPGCGRSPRRVFWNSRQILRRGVARARSSAPWAWLCRL
ncbi:MAG: hypothetical protein WDM81_06465 [Rhizomicrobium sp.]